MVNSKCFINGTIRGTGWTMRNVHLAVWGAVFGKSSVIYTATHHHARTLEGLVKQVCEEGGLDYQFLRDKILIRVPETKGVRPDLVFADNYLHTGIYQAEEVTYDKK